MRQTKRPDSDPIKAETFERLIAAIEKIIGKVRFAKVAAERDRLITERDESIKDLEQVRVQLAGCLTAAEGSTKDVAVSGQYGWSLAYQRTLDLYASFQRVTEENERLKLVEAAAKSRDEANEVSLDLLQRTKG
jgi:hypothetical protein